MYLILWVIEGTKQTGFVIKVVSVYKQYGNGISEFWEKSINEFWKVL